MKVIDLLNKIANGEEVPEKIKFENVIYEYDKERKDYINKIDDWCSETLLFNVMNCHFIEEILENEVKLIEDNNIAVDSIEELEVIDFINTPGKELSREENIKLNNQVLVDYFYIINDIIRNQNQTVQAVKQHDREIKELKEKHCSICGAELTEKNTALPNMCWDCKYGEE